MQEVELREAATVETLQSAHSVFLGDAVVSVFLLIVLAPVWLAILAALSLDAGRVCVRLRRIDSPRRSPRWEFQTRPFSALENLLWATRLIELPLLYAVLRGSLTLSEAYAEFSA
jgi:lipopolysaccharide/colanic/teichoic acid biosynthesis glycosyltransferase